MQNSFIIFQKLLVLFGFMFIGYLSYKKEWITDHTESQLSGLVLNIFNPALIISGVVGSSENGNWTMVLINLLLAVILFAILIFISPLFVRILRIPKQFLRRKILEQQEIWHRSRSRLDLDLQQEKMLTLSLRQCVGIDLEGS